jgi:hypothetical protein
MTRPTPLLTLAAVLLLLAGCAELDPAVIESVLGTVGGERQQGGRAGHGVPPAMAAAVRQA